MRRDAEFQFEGVAAGHRAGPQPCTDARPRFHAESAERLATILAMAGAPRSVLDRAMKEAIRLDLAFEAVLYSDGALTEAEVAAVLTRHFGCASDAGVGHRAAPGQMAQGVLNRGLLRLIDGRIAMMPRGTALLTLLRSRPAAPPSLLIVTRQRMIDLLLEADGQKIAWEASQGLVERFPDLAAGRDGPIWQRLSGCGLLFLAGLWAGSGSPVLSGVVSGFAAMTFLALAALRLVACAVAAPWHRPLRRTPDNELPMYTVLVPLYREEAAVAGLIVALGQIDYPPALLDIKILIEADDMVTRTTLLASALPPWFEVIAVPPGGPRTKPRACNVGLALARGVCTVVFDAEDRPEPGQLRLALQHLGRGGAQLAVVQARLEIDAEQPGPLAALFRMEYAGLFAVILPALARYRLPMPLGGTSNHFRTQVLRSIGGWDAHNVTEDADIGLRLHRMGYGSAIIASWTLEEAPPTAPAWLKQRTRWLKGWMVTTLVHARSPGRLVRELGLRGVLGFYILTAGIILSTLAEPVALAIILCGWLRGEWNETAPAFEALMLATYFSTWLFGHLAAALTGARGLRRSGLPVRLSTMLLLPVYWLGVSLAAWRALGQALHSPAVWEKTDHVRRRMPPVADRSP